MKPIPFYKLSPKMKNIRMNNWIKQYVGRGLSLEDAQFAARWRAGHWKLSARMEKVMAGLENI
jgi:hypothetical protein|tara:strand:- start:950 stop:1138 length:189 start_codon:yes stop_codon:yes gene_type:complete